MTEKTDAWPIIDFHAHIRPPAWKPSIPSYASPADVAWQRSWGEKLASPETLLQESLDGGVDLRLLSSTIEGISGTRGPVDHGQVREHNNFLADLSARFPAQLAALAATDAFSGEAGAIEAERAVVERGHVGIVIDSARDGFFAGHSSTWAVFEAAAALKVPVLVHPVGLENTENLVRAAGRAGNSFGRGHVNGTAFLSILNSGLLDRFPDVDIVFTGIGIGALVIAAAEVPQYANAARESGAPRPNLYFDFMGFAPSVLRFLIDVIGPERVVVGSDWPIWETLTRGKLTDVFDAAKVEKTDRDLIASGNAQRLLGRRSAGAAVPTRGAFVA